MIIFCVFGFEIFKNQESKCQAVQIRIRADRVKSLFVGNNFFQGLLRGIFCAIVRHILESAYVDKSSEHRNNMVLRRKTLYQ